jgi:hypothetical protein
MKWAQRSRRGRKGDVFSIRLTPEERAKLDEACALDFGPRKLGPWMIWRALLGTTAAGGSAPPAGSARAPGSASSSGSANPEGSAAPGGSALAIGTAPPVEKRLILDLCCSPLRHALSSRSRKTGIRETSSKAWRA